MLRFLRIRDFALIRELEVEFGPGLNLLTGETGSGKSIIVDALGLLVGARSSPEQIRSGCESAVVEGVFSVEAGGRVRHLLEESGIPAEDSLIIRREISAGGRGRVHVNHSLATVALLRSIGENLADIHGQQDQRSLLDTATHLEWLDRFGRNEEAVAEVRRRYAAMKEAAARLEALEKGAAERRRRIEVLGFQLEEIRRVRPRAQEKDELERERRVLANRERIFALASESYGILYESEGAIVERLQRLQRLLQELEGMDERWAANREAAAEASYKLQELAFALRDYVSGMDFSPQLLERVEQRLAELERLAAKYGPGMEDVLSCAERCARELDELVALDENSEAFEREFAERRDAYLEAAGALSAKRRADAARLQRELAGEFRALALERMKLEVSFAGGDTSAPGERIPPGCGPAGTDRVQFLVSPDVGEELRPLAVIASGGELARVMLAVKSLCGSGEPGRTLVFDEVDAGIGGRVAEAVGRRLRALAETHQVLCVTHLPQIASFARLHLCVSKQIVGSRTETFVQLLNEKERVEEIARMMGGQTITEITRRHARELLAERSKADRTRRPVRS